MWLWGSLRFSVPIGRQPGSWTRLPAFAFSKCEPPLEAWWAASAGLDLVPETGGPHSAPALSSSHPSSPGLGKLLAASHHFWKSPGGQPTLADPSATSVFLCLQIPLAQQAFVTQSVRWVFGGGHAGALSSATGQGRAVAQRNAVRGSVGSLKMVKARNLRLDVAKDILLFLNSMFLVKI